MSDFDCILIVNSNLITTNYQAKILETNHIDMIYMVDRNNAIARFHFYNITNNSFGQGANVNEY